MSSSLVRVGILGVGAMGADHASRLALRTSGASLVAVSDPDIWRAQAVAGRFPAVRVIEDPLALVAADDVDAVLIASPGAAHESQVLACLSLGKHVLCEKPLTLDSASARRLVAAERSGPRLVQVGFMRRFDPGYVRLKSVLSAGSVGRLLMVHNVHRNQSAPASFRSEMIIRDSLVHEVDVCRWLFDDEIATISVLAPAPSGRAPAGVSDPQVAVFQMARGGVATTEVFVNSQVGYVVRCEAVAELGSVTAGVDAPVVDDFRARFASAYDIEVQAWVDACLAGSVIGPSMSDGYAATLVCEAGVKSLHSGGLPVTVGLPDGT